MKIKLNLHLHTAEDNKDGYFIDYSIYQAIDQAARLGFLCLALSGHDSYLCKPAYIAYARQKGILLIPGIELSLKCGFFSRAHMVILNCDQSIVNVKTLPALAQYKKKYPQIFILAPHPYFMRKSLGGKLLKKYIGLFDAIEHSWFYSARFNCNKKARIIAREFNKPFIATSDTHLLSELGHNFAVVETKNLSPTLIFRAIRRHKIQNHSHPKRFWQLIAYWAKMKTRSALRAPGYYLKKYLIK